MTLIKENYRNRLIDFRVEKYLKIFGAVCIEGPKWCGKTWTSLAHTKSVVPFFKQKHFTLHFVV